MKFAFRIELATESGSTPRQSRFVSKIGGRSIATRQPASVEGTPDDGAHAVSLTDGQNRSLDIARKNRIPRLFTTKSLEAHLLGRPLRLDDAIAREHRRSDCAHFALTHEIVQGMRERGKGGVIFVSSVNGFCASRGMANYNATKAYDLLFAEGLAPELRPHGVDVQALCPGGTLTEFQRVAGLDTRNFGPFARLMFATPTSVVATSLRTLGHRVTVVPGFLNKLMVLSMRLVPRRLSTWILGSVMDRFAAGH